MNQMLSDQISTALNCSIDLSKYDAFLFDVDGTLAETEKEAHLPAFNLAFQKHGLEWRWTPSIYKGLLRVTGGYERLKTYRDFLSSIGKNIDSISDELLKSVHLSKNAIYADLIQQGMILPRDGLIDLVETLDGNQKQWAIVTTTSQSNWRALWSQCLSKKLRSAPQAVVCGEDVQAKKPNPEAYLLAIERLQLDPSRCLAIEDSSNGLTSALQAGIDVLIVKSYFFADEDFDGAKWVVNSFNEISLVSAGINK